MICRAKRLNPTARDNVSQVLLSKTLNSAATDALVGSSAMRNAA
jgi:hypothetical protein